MANQRIKLTKNLRPYTEESTNLKNEGNRPMVTKMEMEAEFV
jgi:hypothetical protein